MVITHAELLATMKRVKELDGLAALVEYANKKIDEEERTVKIQTYFTCVTVEVLVKGKRGYEIIAYSKYPEGYHPTKPSEYWASDVRKYGDKTHYTIDEKKRVIRAETVMEYLERMKKTA